MKDNDSLVVIGVVVVLILGAVSGAFYYRQWSDCNARHGVLIKNAYDWPTCVSMTTK